MKWTDIKSDKFSRRYFLKLLSIERFQEAMEMSLKVLSEYRETKFLMIKFEPETSLIYIYPFKKNNIHQEIGCIITLQLVPYFDYFDSIESKWYRLAKDYEVEYKKVLKDFRHLFSDEVLKLLKLSEFSIQYYAYGYDLRNKNAVVVRKLENFISIENANEG